MSQKMTQKDAVFSAVTSVLSEKGIQVAEGSDFSEHLNKEYRSLVTNILVEGFKSGSIELDKEYETDSQLRTYVSGLVSNWLRKDKRLNGNTKYVAKKPGSRIGSSDPQLKALRQLLTTKTEESEKEEIQKFIDSRVSELNLSKAKRVDIDFNVLPTELRSKYSPEN